MTFILLISGFIKYREKKLNRDKQLLQLKVFEQTYALTEKNEELQISNVVKFTARGGIIRLSAKSNSDKCDEISIKDTGIGMNRAMIDQLFQLDGQKNRKGTEGEPSSGLGLLLCKEFVEKHGGKLWVESEENIGAVFYFTFPFIHIPDQ